MPKKVNYPEKLFDCEKVSQLIWGVTPGGHVAHLIDPTTTETCSVISQDEMNNDKFTNHYYDYKKVSQKEAYTNAGDNETAKHFKKLAEMAASQYDIPGIPNEYKDALLQIKTLVTTGGRQAQQNAILEYKKCAAKLRASVAGNPSSEGSRACAGLNEIDVQLNAMTAGTLQPENYSYNKKAIKEPSNHAIGKFGTWTATNEALFPHEPSPNDIKQGYGINDCFMLAPLAQIASTNPQKIKDAMRDNNDGTVTVRFFTPGKRPKGWKLGDPEPAKEPAYVTVNKTVNKLAGSNVYASSSLWVQMYEKAYIEYLSKYVGVKPGTLNAKFEHSYNDINYGHPEQFLNAFDGEKTYNQTSRAFGIGVDPKAFKPGSPAAAKYAEQEKALFAALTEEVNGKKGTVIVGNSGQNGYWNASASKDLGIRTKHAYAVMNTFEKNGKQYVQLRDPYALFRSKYDASGKLVNDQSMINGTFKGGVSNMGTFNLEMKDFLQNFDCIMGMENNAVEKLTDTLFDIAEKADKQVKQDHDVGFLDDVEMVEGPSAKADGNVADGFEIIEKPVEKANVADDFEIIEKPAEKANVADDFEVIESPKTEVVKGAEVVKESAEGREFDLDDGLSAVDIDDLAEVMEKKPYSEALMNKLMEPNGLQDVTNMVKYLAEDVEKTSMFFSFKNTKNFTTMRDKLNAVNKKLQGGKYTDTETLATELTELADAAETYANSKYDSVMEGMKNKKDPSLRAMHRLADAVSLMQLKNGNTDVAQTELGYAEGMKIVKSDLQTTLQNLKAHMNPTAKTAATNALNAVNSYIQSEPGLEEQFEVVSLGDEFLPVVNDQPTVQQAPQGPAPGVIG
ncbi:MAG: C2 family cysteine protease [Eubacteriales bacterium]|nr:C2 family cysteine protease [Eubacteriales bacterium]